MQLGRKITPLFFVGFPAFVLWRTHGLNLLSTGRLPASGAPAVEQWTLYSLGASSENYYNIEQTGYWLLAVFMNAPFLW